MDILFSIFLLQYEMTALLRFQKRQLQHDFVLDFPGCLLYSYYSYWKSQLKSYRKPAILNLRCIFHFNCIQKMLKTQWMWKVHIVITFFSKSVEPPYPLSFWHFPVLFDINSRFIFQRIQFEFRLCLPVCLLNFCRILTCCPVGGPPDLTICLYNYTPSW